MKSTEEAEYVADILRAVTTVAPFVLRTPLIPSERLSRLTGGEVFLKLENLQRTGSFKVRGAAHRITSLTKDERARGIVTCSSGNHGRAVAYVAQQLGIDATICVPRWVDAVKLSAIQRCGATVDAAGADYDDAERRAFEIARARQLIFVPPFDDYQIIAGQGTLALEILSDEPELDILLAPMSGGGLIAGVALAVRAAGASSRVHAITARNANVMAESLAAGRPVSRPERRTVATALSGGIGLDNRCTFRLVQSLVDDHATVDEPDIVHAMRFLADEHRLVVEGGGATAAAAVLASPGRYRDRRIAVVVSGGNIDLSDWIRFVSG